MSETVKPFTAALWDSLEEQMRKHPRTSVRLTHNQAVALLARLAAAEVCATRYATRWPKDADVKEWLATRGIGI